jgi:GT2 family glycosyltransferase
MELALREGAYYLLIVNNDTVLDHRCVSLLAQALDDDPRAAVVAPKILYHDAPDRIAFGGGDYSFIRGLGLHRHANERDDPSEAPRLDDITFVTGSCFLMRGSVARALGGFREDFFMYCEDVELSLRMRRDGYRMYYQPAARVLHREPVGRVLPPARAAFLRDRNRRRLVRQHYTVAQRLAFAAWFYPSRLVRLGQYLARRDWAGAGAVIAGAVKR